jgi:hypothetical protein
LILSRSIKKPLQKILSLLLSCLLSLIGYSQDIVLHYDSTYSLNTGKVLPVQFEVITAKGFSLYSKTITEGTIPWRKFEINIEGGTFDKGEIVIGNYKDLIDERLIKLQVEYKPLKISRIFLIPLRFNGEMVADFKPKAPKSPTKLRLLRIGRSGYDGVNGKPGQDAPNLLIHASTKIIDKDTLLQALIVKEGSVDTMKYYIDPKFGSLVVNAEGGDGGKGEDGGEGLNAEKGKSSGIGGNGGAGGVGGKGGSITVYFKEGTERMLQCMKFKTGAGDAGDGGSGGKGGLSSFNGTSYRQTAGEAGAIANRSNVPGKVIWIKN